MGLYFAPFNILVLGLILTGLTFLSQLRGSHHVSVLNQPSLSLNNAEKRSIYKAFYPINSDGGYILPGKQVHSRYKVNLFWIIQNRVGDFMLKNQGHRPVLGLSMAFLLHNLVKSCLWINRSNNLDLNIIASF